MTTQQSPDALAMARKTSEAIQLFTKDTSHWPGIEQIILRETKLAAYVACAEALRALTIELNMVRDLDEMLCHLKCEAEQALAALNGNEQEPPA